MAAQTLEAIELSEANTRRQIILTALFLALSPATVVGFGRFAYALVLPSMRQDLQLTYSQAGALGTGNTVGYLLGAILTSLAVSRLTTRNVLVWGFILSVIFLIFAGLTRSFPLLIACRFGVGFSAALANIAATGLAAQLGRNDQENALALGLTTCGPGLGVAFTGATLPFLLDGEAERWPIAWMFLGGVCAAACAVALLTTKHVGNEKSPSKSQQLASEKPDYAKIWPSLVAYFGFGLGYIAYMTFLVAYVRSLSGATSTVALMWIVLGIGMLASSIVWRTLLTKSQGGIPLFLMGVFGAFAASMPLFSTALPVLLISALVFGVTSMAVFTAVTIQIRRHLPESAWTPGIAVATSIFAVGQSLGPLGSGALSDHFGTTSAALWWTAVLMTVAGLVALFQKGKLSFTE